MRSWMVMSGIVLAVAGCASGRSAGADNTVTTRTTASRDNVITAAEIDATAGASTAADLVRMLRPRWRPAQVFVGNSEFGGRLSDIDARSIREIRFLTAPEAQMRWGLRVQEVILVTRK